MHRTINQNMSLLNNEEGKNIFDMQKNSPQIHILTYLVLPDTICYFSSMGHGLGHAFFCLRFGHFLDRKIAENQ